MRKKQNFKVCNHKILLIACFLTLLSALPRLYDLGSLGFYGDEETSALASRSLAEGLGARMPSGMAYYRALPQTWLNSLSAHVFGLDIELSYRLPAAVLGILTVPLLFLMARPLVGMPVAFIAALLLSLSEWHIATSREARMYAPFLLCYFSAAIYTLRWTRAGKHRYFLIAIILFALSVTLHELGIMGIIFALLPLAFASYAHVSVSRMLLVSGASAICAFLYSNYFVVAQYSNWSLDRDVIPTASLLTKIKTFLPESIAILPFWTIALLALTGALVGFWVSVRTEPNDTDPGKIFRAFIRISAATLAGVFAFLGQLYGAFLAATVFLLLHPGNKFKMLHTSWVPVIIIGCAIVAWLVTAIGMFGAIQGLKTLVIFPFPYPAYLFELFPGVCALFAGTTVYLALQEHKPEETILRIFALAVILPMAAVGTISKWGGIRYLIELYPFLLLVAAVGLWKILDTIGRRLGRWSKQLAMAAAIVLVLSGLLGGHGITVSLSLAALRYGDTINELIFENPFYPDHKTPGEYLRRNLSAKDLVISEDPLQQRWYAGQSDIWLQNPMLAGHFAYRGSDGQARDIYVNSQLLTNEATLRDAIRETTGRVWLVTSGEIHTKRDYYLTPWQKSWLVTQEQSRQPVYTGLDGITKVYCVNCATEP